MRRRNGVLAAGALALAGLTAVAATRVDGDAAAQATTGIDARATGTNDTTAAAPATAVVTRRDLVERVTQGGTLGYGDTASLRSNASGTLTATSDVGAIVQRGDLVFSVDGRGVQLFYGTYPFWRDLASGDKGLDVAELEANLVALGYASDAELKGDGAYDAATAKAVKLWQKARGVDQTGTFLRADVVLAPAALRVAKRGAEPGANVGPSAPVLDYTGVARVVTVKLDAAKQSVVKLGDAVQIDIPGGGTVTGKVVTIGRVATDESNGQSAPKIAVTITLDDPKAGASLDQAPVTVKLTKSTARDVLAVPVQALLALAEGGYGVEVVTASGVRLTKVEVGSFADGQVEVRGDLREGDTVVVSS